MDPSASDPALAPDRLAPEPATARRPSRFRDRLLVAAFVAALAVPGAAAFLGLRAATDLEARNPAPAPSFSLDSLGETAYYSALDSYLSDALPIRDAAAEIRASVFVDVLGVSPTPDVTIGRAGWLYTTLEVFPQCALDIGLILDEISRATGALGAQSIPFSYVMVPDKRSIYPEWLPDFARRTATCSDVARPVMRDAVPGRRDIVDLWGPLLDARASQPNINIYWQGDSHWTYTGALAAARALVDGIAPGTWDDSVVQPGDPADHVDDLARLMGIRRTEVTPTFAFPGRSVTSTVVVPASRDSSVGVYEDVVAAGPPVIPGRTLFLNDSFFLGFRDVFSPWFADSYWVNEEELPRLAQTLALPRFDRVIFERAERYAYSTDIIERLEPLLSGH